MGNNTAFTFNMAQSLGNLDELDVTKEEKAVELQIKVLEEYRKVIRNEKKRRAIGESIDKRDKINELRTILKNNRRKERLSTHPYEKYKPSQQLVSIQIFQSIVSIKLCRSIVSIKFLLKYSFHQFEPTGESSDVLNLQWHFF